MGQTGGEGTIEGVPVGESNHQDVAGTALLGHDRHQSVSTEPDRRQPTILGHGREPTGEWCDCQKPLRRLILLEICG